MKQYDLAIIAGPCSITPENTEEIINEIAPITTADGNRAIYGTRVVGLKSRTTLNVDGKGMGIDYDVIKKCILSSETTLRKLSLPSVEIAERIARETGLQIATEVMLPHIQLPFYERKKILRDNLLIWNPAVDQLAWHLWEMSKYAKQNNWDLGIKNGKFLGNESLNAANHPEYNGQTSLEKTWAGLTSYVQELEEGKLILIHRGVDVHGRGDYRNAPVHEIAKRVKATLTGVKLYFDPSHSFGPKLRDHIVDGTIDAMKLKNGKTFLYDGILIEAGTSPSDIDQHITIKELKTLAQKLSEFRKLRRPKENK